MTSYVSAHALDFGSPNPWAAPTRSNADTDVRHNLQAAASWTLPAKGSSGFAHNVLSGWGIDGRFFLRSSYPMTVLGNLFHDPVTGERFYTGADFIPGRPLYSSNSSLPSDRMLNGGPNVVDGAFQLPADNSQGNAPRNNARGFAAQQVSLSLRRAFISMTVFHCKSGAMYSTSRTAPILALSFPISAISSLDSPLSP